MKKMKKLIAVLLTMVMVFAMSAIAFAATITIEGGADGSTYSAWKLLDATNGGEDNKLFAYTVNEKYRTVLQTVTEKTEDADIIAYIAALTGDDIQKFADAVYAEVKDMDADYTTSEDKFDVAQGYYLIAETATGNSEDTVSLVMLDTAGNDDVTVKTKEDQPEVVKKVKETDDSEGIVTDWQDGADYDIGDKISFQLTGTVSDKIANYKTYYYEFHDTLSKGLTYNEDITVTIDGVDVTDSFSVTFEETENGTTISVKCDDIKSIEGVTITADTKVVVEYTATLNKNAVIGALGNPNEVTLEYSNNPYDDGDGKPDTGETPKDTVIVFTYESIVNKVDKDNNALKGAGFTLYKWYYNEELEDGGSWVAVTDEIKGEDMTKFTFTGLDAGKYKLEETTVPAGYNKADDIIFIIESTYTADMGATGAAPTLDNLVVKNEEGNVLTVFTINVSAGTVSTDVVNNSGTELPSTGGIGTTIFYVVGAILVIGAAVLMVTRRRMNA